MINEESRELLKIRENETRDEYKIRICENREAYGLQWTDVASVLNEFLGQDCNESTYRKWWKNFKEGFDYAIVYNASDDTYLHELEEKTNNLALERKKLQTDKLEYNRWTREQARVELFYEQMLDCMKKNKMVTPPKRIDNIVTSKDMILGLADLHYGKQVNIRNLSGDIINSYSVEIAEERLWKIFDKVKTILNKEEMNHINIFNLSDSIDGILHLSQIRTLQIGIIDSVIRLADFLTVWLNELSKYAVIDYYSTWGNHNEIRPLGSGRGDFPQENTERIITWYLKSTLAKNENIIVHDDKEHLYVDIFGTRILGVHGQYEKNLESSLKEYLISYGDDVDLLVSGHYHSSHEKTIGQNKKGNIEYIQMPSIMGIDDYAIRLKKASKASTKAIIFEDGIGKTITYDIRLN